MGRECLANGLCLCERRQCFEGEDVGRFLPARIREYVDSVGMELDEIGEGAGVVAVIFGAIVESCTIGAERCCDDDAAIGECGCSFASQRDRVEQCGIGTRGIEADFSVSHARDLVAGGFDDVCAGLDVGAMYGYDFFGRSSRTCADQSGPLILAPRIFEFGGHAAVEDVGVTEDCIARSGLIAHEFVVVMIALS